MIMAPHGTDPALFANVKQAIRAFEPHDFGIDDPVTLALLEREADLQPGGQW